MAHRVVSTSLLKAAGPGTLLPVWLIIWVFNFFFSKLLFTWVAQEAEEHLIFLLLITENNCYQSTAFFCVLAILADLNKCEYAEDEVHLWLGFLIFTVNCKKKKKDWLWRLILKTGNFTICKEKLFWCETGCTRKSTFYILKSTAVTKRED